MSTYGNKIKVLGILMYFIGIGIFGLAFFVMKEKQFLDSYFFGFITWMCLTLGCYGLTLLHHTVRGKWGLAVLRIYEAGGGPLNFLLMALFFLPISIFKSGIYPWMNTMLREEDPVLIHKSSYLNSLAFDLRTVMYFVIWIGVAAFLRRSSMLQDKNKDSNETARRTNVAAPGLVFFFLTVNFAMTDWVMSLDYHWFSSMFGVWMIVGMGLMALSFGNIIIGRFAFEPPYKGIITPAVTKDLGNMMFVLTMFWGYTSLSQFLIIWAGNLPEFISYYYHRNHGLWQILGAVNIIGQFFMPFLLLLAPRTKATPKLLMLVALWIFLFRFSDLFWQIIPMFRKTGFKITDLAAVFSIGGAWMTLFGIQVQKGELLPAHDTRLLEDTAHG